MITLASWLWAALVLALLSMGLAFVPLFNVLGFEFAVTAGALLASVAGWRACGRAASTRHRRARHPAPDRGFPGQVLAWLLGENLALGLLPLAILGANALRVPACNWSEGLRFYALFGVPGILYGTMLGFALGLAASARRARLLFAAWALATVAFALWNVLREPPIFAYNAFIGFFPGPLYDRFVPITPSLLLARSIVLLESFLFLLLAIATWDGYRLRLRALFFPWTGARALAIPLALVFLALFVALQANAARLGLRLDRRTIQETLGGHIATEHCDIYYDTQAYTPDRARELADEHEFHYGELARFFGFQVPRRIGSYVYASAAQKKRLMGAAGTSFEDALNDEFHINASSWPHPVLRHEMAHIFAAHLHRWWKVNPWIGIHEGVAVAAEWRQESARLGLTPDEACAAMDSLGLLPDLHAILGAFGFWTQPGSRAYTAAGSFVRYLLDRDGMPRFRLLWANRDFAETYGSSLADLVQAWKQERLEPIRLSSFQMQRAERLYRPPAIFSVPCAREQARLRVELGRALQRREHPRADSLYGQLFRIQPDDPALQLGWARERIQAEREKDALPLLQALLSTPDLAPAWRGPALAAKGDVLWELGRLAAADSCYGSALGWVVTRDERRSLHVKRQALRDPQLRETLRQYLTGRLGEAAGLGLLASLRAAAPAAPLPRYLLGRRLYYAERFDAARAELEGLPDEMQLGTDTRLASQELLILCDLRGGAPENVADRLAGLAPFDLETAELLGFRDLAARASWALARRKPLSGRDFEG